MGALVSRHAPWVPLVVVANERSEPILAENESRDCVRFLHLSDIHCSDRRGGAFDLDADLRRGIENDVAALKEELGPFEGILITGDIAYAAAPEEFEKADGWLASLSATAGCARDDVMLVPGNHDVHRPTVSREEAIRAFHAEIRACPREGIDASLAAWLDKSKASSRLVFQPLANYNNFAESYGCSVSPGSPFWERRVPLGPGFALSIRGLTSVLCSDDADDDGAGRLALGRFQVLLPIEKGLVHLTLCHHPPDWLRDRDEVIEVLEPRAHIQLYGHKHRHRLTLSNGSLILSAGAAHPEREPDWSPRFNVLELSVLKAAEGSSLQAKIHPRVFSRETQTFAPDFSSDGRPFRHFEIPIDSTAETATESYVEPDPREAEPDRVKPLTSPSTEIRESTPVNPIRRLGYLLLYLPKHRLEQVVAELGIAEEVGAPLTVGRVIDVAKEHDSLDRLWDSAARFAEETGSNPFSGSELR